MLALSVMFAGGRLYAEDNNLEELKKQAEAGNPRAQAELGKCYEEGKGVPQSLSQAASLYRQAAEQGHPEAQLALAACFEQGLGVDRNPAAARYWRRRAAENSQTTIPES